ncbi:thermonuclease family protein [bacterium]|nr:thermonuclease family protein [bacterium]
MIKFLLIIGFATICNSQTENFYDWKVVKAIDGDTVEVEVDFLPVELGKNLSVRVYGVDTPEKGWRAENDHERKMGEQASIFTKNLLQNCKDIKIKVVSWDKYGGRVLGDVIIDGQSLRQLLLKNGYAREYYGDKKQSWDNYDNNK